MTISYKEKVFNLIADLETIALNDKASKAILTNSFMQKVEFNPFIDDVLIIVNIFPSVDTPTSSIQLKTLLNKYHNTQNIQLINISSDIPYALNRWAKDNQITDALLFSDYYDNNFSLKYGLLIDQLYFIARCVMVIYKKRVIYLDIPDDASNPINFAGLEEKIASLTKDKE